MKYADMPTGMLKGRLMELLEDLTVAVFSNSPSEHVVREKVRDARAELAKRKQSLETHDFIGYWDKDTDDG
tara:strand:+ start:337 stop:549 length:213 start_codon:yes stop_codon:yes gene_type:complete